MENRERKRQNVCGRQGQGGRRAPACPAAGFTLLEMMVVIFVLGVLTAAVVVNWSSFMRHQELRADAISLHKEILALRARAVENDDSTRIGAEIGGSVCTLGWKAPTAANPEINAWVKRTIQLKKDVKIDTAAAIIGDLTKLPDNPAKNNWIVGPGNKVLKIAISPPPDSVRDDHIKTYAFNDGRIVLTSSSAKITARYCIQKDSTCMKPEIYHQTKAGVAWKRL